MRIVRILIESLILILHCILLFSCRAEDNYWQFIPYLHTDIRCDADVFSLSSGHPPAMPRREVPNLSSRGGGSTKRLPPSKDHTSLLL